MREIAHNWISSVRIKVNASRIAAATASAAQSEDRSANQKPHFSTASVKPRRTTASAVRQLLIELLKNSPTAGMATLRPYRKFTNSSILTISALFTLAYLSTLPPSCGFGDVILLPFAAWIIWLKRLFSSTASRARGQSY
jgi:hypothetical protein